ADEQAGLDSSRGTAPRELRVGRGSARARSAALGSLDCRSGCNDSMKDLKKELASLRLHEEPRRSRRGTWVIIALLVVMAAVGTTLWWGSVFAAAEVETTTPRLERSDGAPSGPPLLTASGYVVARRKAVVSAKIQGRLAELRVEEGTRVREGDVI